MTLILLLSQSKALKLFYGTIQTKKKKIQIIFNMLYVDIYILYLPQPPPTPQYLAGSTLCTDAVKLNIQQLLNQ
jgi:hypothetical protein